MIKNGKIFLPPAGDDSDIKQVFNRLVAAGAGRPADESGFPSGPWTPDLLADEISKIEANRVGIDLRTVQLWFQDNDKGISADNIRWLARVVGCDDPDATSAWQAELTAAQARLVSKRRRRRVEEIGEVQNAPYSSTPRPVEEEHSLDRAPHIPASGWGGLAQWSEALFTRKSTLDLPVFVLAGAVIFGLLSYSVNLHSVTYALPDAPPKQIGFLWAPNWTLLFWVVLPLFLVVAMDLLAFWKHEARKTLLATICPTRAVKCWATKLDEASYSFWAVFLICLPGIAAYQWITTRLFPLLSQDIGNLTVDWSRVAILRPDVVSVRETIAFTGPLWLYMGVCTYLFFIGLTLLYKVSQDFREVFEMSESRSGSDRRRVQKIGQVLMGGIFRCSVLGLTIAILMKLQSVFLLSKDEDIVRWLAGDFLSVLSGSAALDETLGYSEPVLFTSFILALVTFAVFLSGSLRIHAVLRRSSDPAGRDADGYRETVPWTKMNVSIGILVAAFLMIGVFDGFSVLLLIAALVAIFSLNDPRFSRDQVL